MTTSEFRPERPALTPQLRAALFASSYSRAKKEQRCCPIVANDWIQGSVPLPVEEILPRIEKPGAQAPRAARVARHIHESLAREPSARERVVVPASASKELVATPTMRREIAFDDDSFTTDVTVSSRFAVTAEQASTILTSALPPQWEKAAPDFFKYSAPVEYDSQSGRIEVHPENARRECYQLYEQVEWDWSETTEGGLANILTIRQNEDHDAAQYRRCLEALRGGSLLLEERELDDVAAEACRDGWPIVEYRFELFRSLRSKFVSNWERGGLDIDEGAYVALWSPVSGHLYINTNKRLRYSARAGGIEGFSSLLNLLAPATVGMLLENLAYQGILEYLDPDD
jgi:hypothetical protein